MSISDAINNARIKINNAYNVLETKGAIMPSVKNLNNISDTINSIPEFYNTLRDWEYSGSNGYLALTNYIGANTDVQVPDHMANTWYLQGGGDTVNSCFYNNEKITSIDLRHVPFKVGDQPTMNHAFFSCSNLQYVNNVNNAGVENWNSAFRGCSNLLSTINIPNSATNLDNSFAFCGNWNPESQVDLTNTKVTALPYTFQGCSKLNNEILLPSTLQHMTGTFRACSSYNQDIQIPSSVNTMVDTFMSCSKLNKDIQIPIRVSGLSGTFESCSAFTSNVFIQSPNVTSASNFFNNTSNSKNVYIPYYYINGTKTSTFNTFKNAGFVNNNGGSLNRNGVSIIDFSRIDNTLSTKWEGVSTSFNGITNTVLSKLIVNDENVAVPLSAPGLDFYLLTSICENSSYLKTIRLDDTPFVANDATKAFYNCYNLVSVERLNNDITSMVSTFGHCSNLNQDIQIPSNVTSMYHTFYDCSKLDRNIQIPSSVTNMSGTFGFCTSLNQNIQIPSSVTNMQDAFTGCFKLTGHINILSENIASAYDCFSGTTLAKDVYLPFKYANGVNTLTFNSFRSAGYIKSDGTTNNQHGVTIYDINQQ